MRIVGLAGESGTGKSTIAAHLAMRGGVHVNADAIAHDLLANDEEVRAAVRDQISAGVFGADGRLDRRRLGAIVFNDNELLRKLNGIIHPAIRRACGDRVEELESRGVPFVVIDAALLLTSRMPFEFDLMIALSCEPQKQFERLMAKGGRTEAEVRARLRSQTHIRDFFHNADVVVDTGKAKEDVFAEVDALVDRLLESDRK